MKGRIRGWIADAMGASLLFVGLIMAFRYLEPVLG